MENVQRVRKQKCSVIFHTAVSCFVNSQGVRYSYQVRSAYNHYKVSSFAFVTLREFGIPKKLRGPECVDILKFTL